jgi:cytochrome b
MDGSSSITKSTVRVWDLPTRIFHWSLVFCIAFAWVSYEYAAELKDNALLWHRWNGYAILVLIVFRLIWGVVGSSTSRFSAFIRWPWFAFIYAIDMLKGKKRNFLGHNPLGTWMIIALVLVVITQGILGLFILDHNGFVAGPLQGLISDSWGKYFGKLHRLGFKLILALASIHIIANSLYGLLKKDPLIRAMVTGVKPVAEYEDEMEAHILPHVMRRAALSLFAAMVIVFGGIIVAGGSL